MADNGFEINFGKFKITFGVKFVVIVLVSVLVFHLLMTGVIDLRELWSLLKELVSKI